MPVEDLTIEGREMKALETRSRDLWLKTRAPNVNSTEISALVGQSPYAEALEIWGLKTGRLEDGFTPTPRMRAGIAFEPVIAKLAAEETGCQMKKVGKYIWDPTSKIGSSFDYQCVGDARPWLAKQGIQCAEPVAWLVEIKNVDAYEYKKKWIDDKPPVHIELQCQHQLQVAGRPGVILAVCIGGNDLKLFPILRDREMGKMILDVVEGFWHMVEHGEPDDIQLSRDAEILCKLYREAKPDTFLDMPDDPDFDDLLASYCIARDKAALWESVKTELKAETLMIVKQHHRAFSRRFKMSAAQIAAAPPTEITEDMVGQKIGGRASFRQFRVDPCDFSKEEAKREKERIKAEKATKKEAAKSTAAADRKKAEAKEEEKENA